MTPTIKPKTCKVCRTPYVQYRSFENWCSPDCGSVIAQRKLAKQRKAAQLQDRKETREKLDAIRTKPQLVALAQRAFNSYIRARDAGKPCISCGRALSAEPNSHDAGHYRSVGSAVHMRFVETNTHAQCRHCNNHLGGNHVEYRKGLIERVGLQEVERIERDQTLRKYTKEGLQAIAQHYRAEARRIIKEREERQCES